MQPNWFNYANPYVAAPNTSVNPNYYNVTLPRYDIIQVNGKQGVDAFQMGPNSKVLLLDETAPIVWFVQTDGAGYKTPTPYQLVPYQEPEPVNLNDIVERINKLEGKYEQLQSYNKSNKPNRQQQRQQSAGAEQSNSGVAAS